MSEVSAPPARLRQAVAPHLDLLLCLLLALAAFALYLRTLTPGVLDGDSGEWQYMANILGVPHSTGYPLYIFLAKAVTWLPIGTPAWRVNLFSALCAALTIPVVYLLAKRGSKSTIAAILAASFFALMPTLWAAATISEVYALNTLLIALTLYLAIRFYDTSKPRDLYLMVFCFGLALTNHRVAFFVAPALLAVLFYRRSVLNIRKLALASLAFLLPLLLYAYIPLRAAQLLAVQSPETWELYPRAEAIVNGKVTAYYNHTPVGVINLITALDNSSKVGFENADGQDQTFMRFENSWNLLREQIDPFGIALALLGIVIVLRRERPLAFVLLSAAVAIAVVSILVRAESTRFYFSGAYLIMVLFLAAGIGWILDLLQKRAAGQNQLLARGLYYAVIVFFAFFPLTAFWNNFARMDQSGNTKYDTYARAVLNDNLAENAVLIAPWEVATPIRYLQYVEGQRPDVLTIHESPVRPQYQKIEEAARRLGRPFYYAQFSPEDKNSDEPRTVQAVAFPLPGAPTPQHPLDLQLYDVIRVLGYDWTTQNVEGIRTARLALYYRVLKPMKFEYVVESEIGDPTTETRGYWSRHPVSEYHPTYLWQPGEYYRDVYDVVLAEDAPNGEYTADVVWYEYDSGTGKRNEESGQTIHLDGLGVGQ